MEAHKPNIIPITKDFCEHMGFDIDDRYHESGNYDWIACKGMLKIHSLKGVVTVMLVTGGATVWLDHIKFIHQVQWLFFYLHNEKI